jgi:hypothetical protein
VLESQKLRNGTVGFCKVSPGLALKVSISFFLSD